MCQALRVQISKELGAAREQMDPLAISWWEGRILGSAGTREKLRAWRGPGGVFRV